MRSGQANFRTAVMGIAFAFFWSTGFIGAKMGSPYIEPFTFLLCRYLITVFVLLVFALATRAPWPSDWQNITHIVVTGILFHAIYLGGIFAAIDNDVPAGVVALVAALQPLFTAIFANSFVGEKITKAQWFGLFLGFFGAALVLKDSFEVGGDLFGYTCAFVGTLAITFATLYQKRFCPNMELRSGLTIQFAAAFVVLAIATPMFESMKIEWTGELIFALLWLIFITTLGSYTLMFTLLRLGEATKVASLVYLTPAITMVMAYLLFGETLNLLGFIGMVIASFGVALTNRGQT